MYQLAALSKPAMAGLLSIQSRGVNQKRIFALGLAYVLSRDLALPAEGSEDQATYFRLQHELTVVNTLSSINELVPFNYKQCLEDVKAFFGYRNKARNPEKYVLAINPETSLVDFFSISTFFSNEVIAEIMKNGQELSRVISELTSIYEDIKLFYKNSLAVNNNVTYEDSFGPKDQYAK